MLKRVLFAAVLVLVFSLAVGCDSDSEGTVDRIAIAGGPMGGAYYPISLGVSEAIMAGVDGLTVDVVTTAGSLENALFIGTGEYDMGLTTSDAASEAIEGIERFAGQQQKDIRLLYGGLAGGVFHIAVSGDINSVADLEGLHVAIGPEGSSSPNFMARLFEEYGFTLNDIRSSYLPFDEGVRALMDGQVDAAVLGGAIPMAAIQEMAATASFNYKILSIEDEVRASIVEKYPIYQETEIPAGTYDRQDEVVKTVMLQNLMAINANLSDDLVYDILTSIFDNLSVIHDSHPAARALKLETAPVTGIIPIHPGAERFYREHGLLN